MQIKPPASPLFAWVCAPSPVEGQDVGDSPVGCWHASPRCQLTSILQLPGGHRIAAQALGGFAGVGKHRGTHPTAARPGQQRP